MYSCVRCGHKSFDEVCEFCGGRCVDLIDHADDVRLAVEKGKES